MGLSARLPLFGIILLVSLANAEDFVAVNSFDGRDVLSGIFYANVKGYPVRFLPSPAHDLSIFLAKVGSNHSVLLVQSAANPVSILAESELRYSNQVELYASQGGAETNLDLILNVIERGTPDLIIVDSIQTMYRPGLESAPGSVSQVRESTALLLRLAKTQGIPIFVVGHVTKDGDIAGPKMLEHMVDTVLELSGDRQHLLRLLRTVKNRFGPTDETGIFRMNSNGLEEVKDPGSILLEGRVKNAPGSCLTMIMEGTRPLTVEIQALAVSSPLPIPRRIAKGISGNRLQLICAILTKHLNLSLATKDVFVNVTGGMDIKDPGADLGIALAILSSVKDKPLPENSICFGELGLLGEIRKVGFTDKMLKEAKALGYTTIFSPISQTSIRSIKLM